MFRETLAALAQVLDTGRREGVLRDGYSADYFLANLNSIKLCATNSSTEGCWDTATQGTPGTVTYPGVILHNGATITGFENNLLGDGSDGIWIDWNWVEGPNQAGQDQLGLYLCVETGPCTNIQSGRPRSAGVIGPSSASGALYDEIFQ